MNSSRDANHFGQFLVSLLRRSFGFVAIAGSIIQSRGHNLSRLLLGWQYDNKMSETPRCIAQTVPLPLNSIAASEP